VVLANGFELDCVRQEAVAGERVRLYTGADSYMEVAASAIRRVEVVADAPVAPAAPKVAVAEKGEDLKGLLADAGARHRIDVDLLAAVVKQESGGQVAAVSRAGAAGLMQLMPGTAAQLGVKDRFKAKDNVDGGTAYLDALLTRYHDDVVKALAAYNAGPGAVDRWGGVPPYKETRAYVARIIAEFNRRKRMEMAGR
jgi:soluble lytic murein transglycosylase-like protein